MRKKTAKDYENEVLDKQILLWVIVVLLFVCAYLPVALLRGISLKL